MGFSGIMKKRQIITFYNFTTGAEGDILQNANGYQTESMAVSHIFQIKKKMRNGQLIQA